MRWNGWIGGVLCCGIAAVSLGCDDGASAGEVGDVAAPSSGTPSAYGGGDGFPGPWWRHGSTRTDFDSDLRSCRKRSAEARRTAREDPPDAAYREFVACMAERAWNRGAPPAPRRMGPG